MNLAVRQLESIARYSNGRLVANLEPILTQYFRMTAGFTQASVGWEHPPASEWRAREKRYTPEGIRRDLARIRTAARKGLTSIVRTELRDASHTSRNYLSRNLKCEQDVDAIMQKALPEVESACTAILQSPVLWRGKGGRRVSEPEDRLVLTIAHVYEALTGLRAGRAARDGRFMRVLRKVADLAGAPRSADAPRDRYLALLPAAGKPPRLSRFGPFVLIGRKTVARRD